MRLYLHKSSRQYRYAWLVWQGYSLQEVRERMNVTPVQADGYRQKIIAKAVRQCGVKVNFTFALRMVFCDVSLEEREG